MLVQRNLGANAGLDYRELVDFLSAIIAREESALAALLQTATAKPDTETLGEASALTSLLSLVADGPFCRCSGQSADTCGDCVRQSSQTAASQVGEGGQQGCCCAARFSADTKSTQELGHALWRRTDCMAAIVREVVEESRHAVVLQCLFNVKRAQLALRELEYVEC